MILSEPGFREGGPFIAGTRRSVESIAAMYRHGETPEEIAAAPPEIPRAKIFAAPGLRAASAGRSREGAVLPGGDSVLPEARGWAKRLPGVLK